MVENIYINYLQKKRIKKRNKLLVMLIILILILILILISNSKYNKPPIIKNIKYSNKYLTNNTRRVTLTIKKYNSNNVYCKFDNSDWILAYNNKCSYNVVTKNYKISLKYNSKKIISYNMKFNIDGIVSIKINNKKKYIASDDSFNIDAKEVYIGNVDSKIIYKSSNSDIISIDENGNIIPKNNGKVTISAVASNNMKDSFELISTNLIRKKVLDNNKPIIPCNSYSKEQVDMLDDILKTEVDEAGVGTRGAAAVVARFLTLELPYKVPYFYENGRLTQNGVEGEGRYYKKGIYSGVDKENQIKKSMVGPASWGCPLTNFQDEAGRRSYYKYPNGLDCSGYISWILYNAGLNLGDIGAGSTSAYDYTDVGEKQTNTYDLLHSGKVKVGDLIGWDGHIALIAAMSDTKIYITESLIPGVILDEYDYSSPYSRFYSRYPYIINMENNYKGDGNLKNMW